METTLEDRFTARLTGALGLKSGAGDVGLAKAERAALGRALISAVVDERALSPSEVHRVVPRRTWIRRKVEGKLAPAEFDGLYRLLRLRTLAELVFDDQAQADEWLASPKRRLGGKSPSEFAQDWLGQQVVENWLHEIDQGSLA